MYRFFERFGGGMRCFRFNFLVQRRCGIIEKTVRVQHTACGASNRRRFFICEVNFALELIRSKTIERELKSRFK